MGFDLRRSLLFLLATIHSFCFAIYSSAKIPDARKSSSSIYTFFLQISFLSFPISDKQIFLESRIWPS